ncbi:MAG: hypothetical protein R3Y49_06080 [Rikenellaceae bacterium]
MKTKLSTLLLICCSLLLITSCQNEPYDYPIYDYSPYEIQFQVQNNAGYDLLDPE